MTTTARQAGPAGTTTAASGAPSRPPTWRLALRHARANTVELFRQPGYWLPSVLLPALFFLFFGITGARAVGEDPRAQAAGLGSEVVVTPFLLFGLIGVVFFQFGVGIAEERRQPWETTLRVLPLPASARFAGRVLTALVFCTAAIACVGVLALATTQVRLTAADWAPWLASVLAGAVPFGLMGLTLGYAATPKAALPIANIGFLLLSFGGGLFVPPEALPSFVAAVTPYLPTNHYLRFALGSIDGNEASGLPAGWLVPGLYLLGWTVLFALAAALAYRRDEGVRYR